MVLELHYNYTQDIPQIPYLCTQSFEQELPYIGDVNVAQCCLYYRGFHIVTTQTMYLWFDITSDSDNTSMSRHVECETDDTSDSQ